MAHITPLAFEHDAPDTPWTVPSQRIRHVRHAFELVEGIGHGAQINGNSAYFWANASDCPSGDTVGLGRADFK